MMHATAAAMDIDVVGHKSSDDSAEQRFSRALRANYTNMRVLRTLLGSANLRDMEKAMNDVHHFMVNVLKSTNEYHAELLPRNMHDQMQIDVDDTDDDSYSPPPPLPLPHQHPHKQHYEEKVDETGAVILVAWSHAILYTAQAMLACIEFQLSEWTAFYDSVRILQTIVDEHPDMSPSAMRLWRACVQLKNAIQLDMRAPTVPSSCNHPNSFLWFSAVSSLDIYLMEMEYTFERAVATAHTTTSSVSSSSSITTMTNMNVLLDATERCLNGSADPFDHNVLHLHVHHGVECTLNLSLSMSSLLTPVLSDTRHPRPERQLKRRHEHLQENITDKQRVREVEIRTNHRFVKACRNYRISQDWLKALLDAGADPEATSEGMFTQCAIAELIIRDAANACVMCLQHLRKQNHGIGNWLATWLRWFIFAAEQRAERCMFAIWEAAHASMKRENCSVRFLVRCATELLTRGDVGALGLVWKVCQWRFPGWFLENGEGLLPLYPNEQDAFGHPASMENNVMKRFSEKGLLSCVLAYPVHSREIIVRGICAGVLFTRTDLTGIKNACYASEETTRAWCAILHAVYMRRRNVRMRIVALAASMKARPGDVRELPIELAHRIADFVGDPTESRINLPVDKLATARKMKYSNVRNGGAENDETGSAKFGFYMAMNPSVELTQVPLDNASLPFASRHSRDEISVFEYVCRCIDQIVTNSTNYHTAAHQPRHLSM
jgi:hypothetical protein